MHKAYTLILLATISLGVISCQNPDEPLGVTLDNTPYMLDYGNLTPPELPDDNPLTLAGVKLGRMLFYEKQLSADGSQACASCHLQEFAFTDTAQFSIGVRGEKGKRHAMSVFNMAWNSNAFFWDGRAELLRHQALLPIQDELEMDETLDNVVSKLSQNQMYKDQFIRAFGSDEINEERISLALEQFMNSIVSKNSKYDRFLDDSTLFSASEKRGRDLFFKEYNQFIPEESGADCAHCHSGINFENDRYMNNGLDSDEDMKDEGRFAATGVERDKGKFKVTSLRNIELTPPYMHDGRFNTLEEVIDHYNEGIVLSSTIDPALEMTHSTGLRLTERDKQDLIAFLKTLTDYDLLTNPEYSNPF